MLLGVRKHQISLHVYAEVCSSDKKQKKQENGQACMKI